MVFNYYSPPTFPALTTQSITALTIVHKAQSTFPSSLLSLLEVLAPPLLLACTTYYPSYSGTIVVMTPMQSSSLLPTYTDSTVAAVYLPTPTVL